MSILCNYRAENDTQSSDGGTGLCYWSSSVHSTVLFPRSNSKLRCFTRQGSGSAVAHAYCTQFSAIWCPVPFLRRPSRLRPQSTFGMPSSVRSQTINFGSDPCAGATVTNLRRTACNVACKFNQATFSRGQCTADAIVWWRRRPLVIVTASERASSSRRR